MLSFINRASARRLSTPIRPLSMLIIGDSIADGTASTYASDYVTALSNYAIDGTIYDAAQGGLNLADFYDAGARGAYYTARITNDNGANLSDINAVLICLGTNDGGSYGSKSAWKTNLQGLVDELNADTDLSNLTDIFIRPLGRYTTNNQNEISWQYMREAQIEVCNENANVYLLPPYYDLDLVDSVHPTEASYQKMIVREAKHIAYILGQQSVPNNGLEISNAVIGDDGITMTVIHQGGNDITVPSLGGVEAFDIDGVSYSSIKRISANEFQLYLGAPLTGTPDIKVMAGAMYGLGLINVPMVRDNSEHTLPTIARTITPSNPLIVSDPILQLSGLAYYSRPDYGKTITVDNQFSSLSSVNGGNMETRNGDFAIDVTAFGGAGGIHAVADANTLGGTDDRIDPINGYMVGFVIDVDVLAEEKELFALGDSSYGPYASAKFYTTTNNRIYCYRTDTNTALLVKSGGVFGGRLAFILNVKSTTEADLYINDTTTPTVSFDPHVDMALAKSLFLNGAGFGNALNKFGCVWGKSGAHDGVNDPSILTLMNYMKTTYNV